MPTFKRAKIPCHQPNYPTDFHLHVKPWLVYFYSHRLMITLFQMLFSTCDVLIETLKNHIQEIVILKLVIFLLIPCIILWTSLRKILLGRADLCKPLRWWSLSLDVKINDVARNKPYWRKSHTPTKDANPTKGSHQKQ